MAQKIKSVASFSRKGSSIKTQPKILIICEDSKSGRRYIEDATRYFKVHVSIKVAHCGKTDPKGIVFEAINQKNNYDSIFCAIDRDTHLNYNEAINLARTVENIKVISSHPCIEYWYFLHYGYSRKTFNALPGKSPGDQMVAELKGVMPGYDKSSEGNLFMDLFPKLDDAKRYARKVLEHSNADGSFDPSTKMHELIELFEKLSVPQLKDVVVK
ncbi:RloB family protein [Janthinobacterium sp. P210005]|uniref:RloB family protein n=1 Tax=Janthinobacterium sp. P210005 TaxID=3112938 RepID=UPI002E269054|nr:RloB family protein [Janthinobacterium sp. P210005]